MGYPPRNRDAARSRKTWGDQMSLFVRTMVMGAVAAMLISCGGGGGDSVTGTTGGGGGGTGGTTNNTVCSGGNFCMGNATFFPDSVAVTAGSTVVWVNNSGVTHNVTFDNPGAAGPAGGGSSGNTGDFSTGTASRVFSTPGLYRFQCTIHGPSMHGTILVQ
jgi:plastocyanin